MGSLNGSPDDIIKVMFRYNNPLSEENIRYVLENIVNKSPIEQEKIINQLKKRTNLTKRTLKETLDSFKTKPEKVEKEPKEEQEEILETSMIEYNDQLYEEIVNENGDALFVTINKEGTIKLTELVYTEDSIYRPINDDSIKEGAVLLPTGLAAFGNIETLIEEIQDHVHKYLDVGEDFEIFITYYILLTWVFDKVSALPYLRALGDTGSGKSRYLDVVGRLCYKPCMVSGSITPAPIYRMIRKWHGTLIIDEADFKDSSEYNEVITILNCGFEVGRPVIRCEKDNPDNLQFLPTYSPKVIATRQSFKDKALESRCLTEIMRQTQRKDIPAILPKEFYEATAELRNKLLCFRFAYRDKIDDSSLQTIDLGDIEPRLKQATSSFAVLFANIPEIMDKFKEFLQKYQRELIEERANTYEGMIVNTIFDLLNISSESNISNISYTESLISAKNIVEKLEDGGFNTTPQSVGKRLRSLGFKTNFNPKEKKRVIDLSDSTLLLLLYKRYSTLVPDILDKHDTHDREKQERLSGYSNPTQE